MLPRFDGQRCVHSLVAEASCRACLEACPLDALIFDEDAIGIDTQACDSCGLCSAVCPQGAISTPFKLNKRIVMNGQVAHIACDRAGQEPPTLPCIHAVGLRELVQLYQSGVRELLVASVDCESCPRSRGKGLQAMTDHVSKALESRGFESLKLRAMNGTAWQRERDLVDPSARLGNDRRLFFRSVFQAATEGPTGQDDGQRALFDGLKHCEDPVLHAVVPRIDTGRCSGCDACAHLCPTGAITRIADAESLRYVVKPDFCTGCSICRDVCKEDAVTLDEWQEAGMDTIFLETGSCRICGNPFHRPQLADDQLCGVCTQKNHYKALYQVNPD